MTTHTPEPWRIDDECDCYTRGRHICGDADDDTNGAGIAGIWIDGELDPAVQDANARRIVACVNACAGIPDEHLQSLAVVALAGIEHDRISHWDKITELQERLDRLLVSVDAAANWIRNCSTPMDAASELEMAAAKARGGK